MLGLAEGRVHAAEVADVAPVEDHGHVPGECAVVVPDGGREGGVRGDERAERIPCRLPGMGFNRNYSGPDDLPQCRV